MINSISFQTRARTIDHLGREQIADCPTAISELWKNAFDAYARKVELHIFDGEIPVCALVDDGHGMNRQEFEEKWLTIGTDSKLFDNTSSQTPEADRNGLPIRPKQGQKGIGRLSSAALGYLLLIVSKRKGQPFVASLIDWRIFQNPFLMLNDVQIPVIEFDEKNELENLLPDLFDKLLDNIWGSSVNLDRSVRLKKAWQQYEEHEESKSPLTETTKSAIEKLIVNATFTTRHLSVWPVWNKLTDNGTAMFIAGIHDDLNAQVANKSINDIPGDQIRARQVFLQSLSNFTDPFLRDNESNTLSFSTSVTVWNGPLSRPIIGEDKEFDITDFEDLEHIIEGNVDNAGFFRGRVKTFGKWLEKEIVIKPREQYKTRSDSSFGPFQIRVGAFEYESGKTTLSDQMHAKFTEKSDRYGGFMIYRDGLRVMPYGREDNDYFEIEKRRTKNAGRYFWSNRRLFGRTSITREKNPNLKDKAGREGLVDNRASKLFRDIVENILVQAADNYFGSKSKIREETLELLRETKELEKSRLDREKILKRHQTEIRKFIRENLNKLQDSLQKLEEIYQDFSDSEQINSLDKLSEFKQKVAEQTTEIKSLSLINAPKPQKLGKKQLEDYRSYRKQEAYAMSRLKELDFSLNNLLDQLIEKSDYDVAFKVFKSRAATLHASIRNLSKQGREILISEAENFNTLVEQRNKAYHVTITPHLEDLRLGQTSLKEVLDKIDDEYHKQDIENIQLLRPYITALTNIREQIDLEGLTVFSMNETAKWKAEVERLHQLAQLGITVEIIGHEIESLDMTISRGLKALNNVAFDSQQQLAYKSIQYAQQSLSDKWRFLSPLKLSGDRMSIRITGNDIFDYVKKFLGISLERNNVYFSATDSFLRISLYEQQARLYPVFINIVNNARYWVEYTTESEKKIIIDCQDSKVIIADNGPGVDDDDLEQLFTLFFSKKQRGGRGVGLYLCKQNLQAAGHKIRYETNKTNKILSGANFVIELKGASFD